MSELELNKIVASVLVAGLVFMTISVGVDELWREQTLESPVYPVPELAAADAPAEEEAAPAPAQSIASRLAAADAAAGEKVAKKCATCHDLSQGGPNKVGPNLWNVVGSPMASTGGFSYSDALAGMDGAWDYEALDAFLTKPKDFAPGTKMTFAGVKDPQDRADLIAYLRGLSDSPPPLPAE